jgi:hypothetical protein
VSRRAREIWPPLLGDHAGRIAALIQGRRGDLRRSPPRPTGDTALDNRAYYVWRMARFSGGADVTMPVLASIRVGGDPERDNLDVMADRAAERYFGTCLAGAHRWSSALRGTAAPDGLPPSAYPGGPAHDWRDPLTCASEAGSAALLEAERGEADGQRWVLEKPHRGRVAEAHLSPTPEEAEYRAGLRQLELFVDEEERP